MIEWIILGIVALVVIGLIIWADQYLQPLCQSEEFI